MNVYDANVVTGSIRLHHWNASRGTMFPLDLIQCTIAANGLRTMHCPVTLPFLEECLLSLTSKIRLGEHTTHQPIYSATCTNAPPQLPFLPNIPPIENVWNTIGQLLLTMQTLLSEDELCKWLLENREPNIIYNSLLSLSVCQVSRFLAISWHCIFSSV
ncbi:hypothetical protein TNCV_3957211 [Trichonephila clavipes]|nr:hypothetical protein TNCV_3957211 [Trichonephila clavipes]